MTASAIDAGRLLASLDEQWRAIGKNEGGVLRASSMTLAVLAGAGRGAQELGSTIAELMHEHPSRTIVLRVRDGDEPLEARTSMQCWMPFGRRQQICCEQIELGVGAGSLEGVPPVLFGLTVADLPVVFWCADLPLALRPELRAVLNLAGKVIVDTAPLESARASWTSISALLGERFLLADLVWARVTRWRELLFNALGPVLPRKPERARISWAGTAPPAAAMYLGAWLVSTFGWQGEAAKRLEFACEDPAPPPPGQGRLRLLTLEGKGCSLRLRRAAGSGVSIEVDGVQAEARFPVLTDSALLREELAILGRDRWFDAAVSACPEILEVLG